MADQSRNLNAASNSAGFAAWTVRGTPEEARAYLQERLSLFSKLMFWIFWVLVAFVFALYVYVPTARPEHATFIHVFAIGGLIFLSIVWYVVLHRETCSIKTLYRIDLTFMVLIGLAFGISAYFSMDKRANVYAAFIWHTFAVFTRVIILPSTGRRSAVVSSLSFVPLAAAAIVQPLVHPEFQELPPLALSTGCVMFTVVAVILSANGSRLIFGLRKQIREAQQLGQYRLGEKIADGGMGSVYRATHAMLRRPTAIKLLPVERYGVESLARFEDEVRHTCLLTHPNTVAIFDYGRSVDGVFYYAMEFIDGIDLEQLVRRFGPQPAPRVARILRQVCGALAEAHSRALIHRDIKPGNIMLCEQGLIPDVAKVLDFGLVRQGNPKDGGVSSRISGTPAFVAPEVILDPSNVGPLSDLYSLGCVGYFLLCGERPFSGHDAVTLCVQHATATPPLPSTRTSKPIPEELEALIMQCLAKDPAARPEGADAMASALEAMACYADWEPAEARAWWDDEALSRPHRAPTSDGVKESVVTIEIPAGSLDNVLRR